MSYAALTLSTSPTVVPSLPAGCGLWAQATVVGDVFALRSVREDFFISQPIVIKLRLELREAQSRCAKRAVR